MVSKRFEPSQIGNKAKREDVAAKQRKAKTQQKLKKRLERAKVESQNPALKKVRDIFPSYRMQAHTAI